MADERIEVEWIATANKMVQVLDRLEGKFDRQEKQLEKVAKTSEKAADAAAGSYNALEAELKQAEAALKRMTAGTEQFAAQKKKVDALRASMAGMKTEIQAAGQSTSGVLSAGVGKVTQLVAGMVSFQAAVQAVVAELEKGQKLRTEAAASTRTFEQSLADMALNIGAANVPQAREMILGNAEQLGVTPAGLAQLFSAAISGGAADLDEALKLSSATLKMTAGDVTRAQPIMSGMLSLAGATGQRDFTASLGQLSQFQAAARGEDLATSINNMSTALAAANTPGDRIGALGSERTLELASVMSQILQDPRMAVTGTAMRQMVMRMDAFTARDQVTLDDGTVSRLTKEQVASFNALNTLDDRLQAMRQTPALGQQFLSTIENSEGKVAIRQLVLGGQAVKDLEEKTRGLITGIEGGQAEFDNLSQVIADNTQLTRVQNQAQAAQEVGRIGNRRRAIEGQIIEEFNRVVQDVNISGVDILGTQLAQLRMNAAIQQDRPVGPVAVGALTAFQGRALLGGEVSARDRQLLQQAIDRITDLAVAQQAGLQRPVEVKVQAPAARPKEAPLPAEFAP